MRAGRVARPESPLECRRVLRGLNATLPADVAVVAVEEAPAGFNARFSARGKWYRYTIHDGPSPAPLHRRTAWDLRFALDEARMASAGRALIGTHDFRGFAREAMSG